MKQTLVLCATGLLVLASTLPAYADLPRPKTSPAPSKNQVTPSLHTSLVIVPDANASQARLQISQDTLGYLRAAFTNTPVNESLAQRIAHSSPRTILAGLFLFMSVSFAGVWLARSENRRSQKAIAAVLLSAAVLGA